jgi:hypothetical protein
MPCKNYFAILNIKGYLTWILWFAPKIDAADFNKIFSICILCLKLFYIDFCLFAGKLWCLNILFGVLRDFSGFPTKILSRFDITKVVCVKFHFPERKISGCHLFCYVYMVKRKIKRTVFGLIQP